MTAQTIEILALAIAEVNLAFVPGSEAFIYRNPGKLHSGENLRKFTTWAGGLKSLISELIRYKEKELVLAVATNYGCSTVEKEFVVLDYLSRGLGKEVTKESTLYNLEYEEGNENA
jgi:hypothetical protein